MNNRNSYSLRKATEIDFDFVRILHHRTLREYIEPIWGWDEPFQDEQVRMTFDPKKFKIIQYDSMDIGIITTEDHGTEIYLANISLVPEFQNKGIGSNVIQQIIMEAKNRKLPISLQVLKTNASAKRLYERLGFKTYSETSTHFKLRRSFT